MTYFNEEAAAADPVRAYIGHLVGGAEKYTVTEAAQLAGSTETSVRRFWQAMGFPLLSDNNERVFTDYDLEALKAQVSMRDRGLADHDTLNSLVRSQSHLADRMVLWQYEALVDEFKGRYELSDVDARRNVLENIGQYEEFFYDQMIYAWRRHMASLMARANAELESMEEHSRSDAAEGGTLQRAFGFVDLANFTRTSGQLSPHALVDFVQTFEFTCRDVISTCGARVVKMVGDAVLYIADDLATGITVVDKIIKALDKSPYMPDARASLVWGRVISRFGDIFGASVNLASRLCSVAPVNGILVDNATAEALQRLNPGAFSIAPYGIPELEGIGAIDASQVRVL